MKNLPSPCISICELNKSTGYCDGCFRTEDEIALWPLMSEKDKLNMLKILRQRQGIKRRVNRRKKI